MRNPWISDVLKFYHAMGPCKDRLVSEPTMLSGKAFNFRYAFIQEELQEFKEAYDEQDFVEMADAIGDLLYVVIGTGIEMGLDLDAIWNEVQRSNMTKVNGYQREDGKWMKGDDFSPPDLEPLIAKMKSIIDNGCDDCNVPDCECYSDACDCGDE